MVLFEHILKKHIVHAKGINFRDWIHCDKCVCVCARKSEKVEKVGKYKLTLIPNILAPYK